MTSHEFCSEKTLLVTYLYGECDDTERRAVEDHLAVCVTCSAEIDQLRSVRASLADWAAPERVLGVRIASPGEAADESPAPVQSRRDWTPPWWLQAAAAVLLVAAAAGLAQIEVRYGSDGLVVRTGWSKTAAPVPASGDQEAVRAGRGQETTAEWRQQLAALERDLRQELSAVRAPAAARPGASQNSGTPGVGGLGSSEAMLLRRVQVLIDQSEQRQQRELAERLAGVVGEVDAQRWADLRGVQRTLGQLEGQTDNAVLQNQALFNYLRPYLISVSEQR